MAGLMVDVDIMLLLLQQYFPDLLFYLEERYLMEYFKNILFQWFLSLFIQNFSYEAGLVLWDILFIDRYIVLFKAVVGLVKYIYKDLMSDKIQSLEGFRNFLKDSFSNFSDYSYLLYFISLRKFEFNINIIEKNRNILGPHTIDHINKINTHKLQKLKEKIKILDEECNLEWPICIYDAEAAYKVIENFIYKSNEKIEIIEDYFNTDSLRYRAGYFTFHDLKIKKIDNSQVKGRANSKSENYFENENTSLQNNLTYFNILIERREHCCDIKKRNKNRKIPTGYSVVLNQLNNFENEESVNISTGSDEKSNDISIDKSVDRSVDKSLENFSSNEKEYGTNHSTNSKILYMSRKKMYKDMSEHINYNYLYLGIRAKQCMSLNHQTPEKDFQAFVTNLNLKRNN